MKLKVKIIKCSGKNYWYADRIGEIFDILIVGDFRLDIDNSKFINIADCEIVREENETKN